MRTLVRARGRRALWRGVLGALLLLAGCGRGDDGDDEASLACDGMVDEDLLTEMLGTEIDGPVGSVEPPPRQSDCHVPSRDQPEDTYMNVYASHPSEPELAEMRRDWPRTTADVPCRAPWRDPWLADGDGDHGYACVDHDEDHPETVMRSLWGDLHVEVRISRPRPRPGDAEDAYRIAADVAHHLGAS